MTDILGRTGKSIGVAGAIVTISDLMQPLTSIAAYIIPSSITLVMLFLFFKYVLDRWDENLAVATYFCTGLFIFSSVTYIAQHNSENGEKVGVIASNIPQLYKFQETLGIISEDVRKIQEAANSINFKMDNVKKEISEDPRKEVANLGLSWSESTFLETLGDPIVSSLFVSGGMKANGEVFGEYLMAYTPNKTAKRLIESGVVFEDPVCPTSSTDNFWHSQIIKSETKVSLAKNMCNREVTVRKLRESLNNVKVKKNTLNNSTLEESDLCFNKLSEIGLQEWKDAALLYYKKSIFEPNEEFNDIEVTAQKSLVTLASLYGMNVVTATLEEPQKFFNSIRSVCVEKASERNLNELNTLSLEERNIKEMIAFWEF